MSTKPLAVALLDLALAAWVLAFPVSPVTAQDSQTSGTESVPARSQVAPSGPIDSQPQELPSEPLGTQAPADARHPLRWSPSDEVSLELRGYLGLDALSFPRTEVGYGPSRHTDLLVRRALLSPQVELGSEWTFRLDLDLAEYDPFLAEVWVQYRPWRELAVRAGRIRIPFGLAQMTPFPDLKLIGRPLVAGGTKDLRDEGVLLLGTLWGERLSYQAGFISGSRDVAVDVNETPDGVAMLQVTPWARGHWRLQGLELAGFASLGDGPTRHGFRGRTMAEFTFADPPTIRGIQWRVGGSLAWKNDLFHLSGEYQYLHQDRDGVGSSQRIGDQMREVTGLEPYLVQGWNVQGSWHLFGRRSLQRPITGLELAARFEQFDFSDGERAVQTAEGAEDHAPLTDGWVDGITAGVNAYLGYRLRLSLVWQGLWFSRASLAPDFEDAGEDQAEAAGTSDLVHHLFLRILGEV